MFLLKLHRYHVMDLNFAAALIYLAGLLVSYVHNKCC